MQNALTFIIKTLVDLYIITFVLRLILQWVRADFGNPLTQFVLKVTNPLVMPLRRMVPSVRGLDTATLLVVLLLEMVITLGLVNLTCVGNPEVIQLVLLTVLRLTYLILRIFLFVIFIYVLLSWISPGGYHPIANLLGAISEPILRPFRNLIPSIGGIDLSPLFALIAIQALTMVLPIGPVIAGMGCLAIGQLL
jgi:YggT family protein